MKYITGLFFVALFISIASSTTHKSHWNRRAAAYHDVQKRNLALESKDTADNAGAPCAIASNLAAKAASNTQNSNQPVIISAKVAHDCLESVPLHKDAAQKLLTSLAPYMEWHSTINTLKQPPSDYQFPAVDLIASLSAMGQDVQTGNFTSEYEFQTALYNTIQSAHDFHLVMIPDAIGKAFFFQRPVALVSVSKDGVEVPKIYTQDDIVAYVGSGKNGTTNNTMPSAVTQINGQDAVTFIENESLQASYQDRDALYNNMFSNTADAATKSAGGAFTGNGGLNDGGFSFPSENTTLKFDNGTEVTMANTAFVNQDMTGVVDGNSFFQRFCTGPTPAGAKGSNQKDATPKSAPTQLPGYPPPIVLHSKALIGGYFLDGDNSDIAVLSIPSFEPEGVKDTQEFQSVARGLISKAKAQGKSKLIVDLSTNSGGLMAAGYDLFGQLFPQMTANGFTRFRANEALNIIGDQFSREAANINPAKASDQQLDVILGDPYNFRRDLNLNNQPFESWPDLFGPQVSPGPNSDNFTNILRLNFAEPLVSSNPNTGVGITVSGFGAGKVANATQPFASSDMVMLHDGRCGSTCANFAEFLRTQGSVKSVIMGGRPNTDPIQAIGGSKGTNNFPYNVIFDAAQTVLAANQPAQGQDFAVLQAISDLPMNRSVGTSLNVRDNILPDDLETGIAAQFKRELADCRLFYTPEMTVDVTAQWRAVANAAWGNGKCVAGNMNATATAAAGGNGTAT